VDPMDVVKDDRKAGEAANAVQAGQI